MKGRTCTSACGPSALAGRDPALLNAQPQCAYPISIPRIQRIDMPGDPFTIDVPPDPPLRRAAVIAVRPLLAWVSGLGALSRLYRPLGERSPARFPALALDALTIRIDVAGSQRHLPRHGAVLVMANHPHGALDGLALLSAAGAVRSDVRLLANFVLERIPELREQCFFVDPFGGRQAPARSLAGLRAARRWLAAGGALIAFPAGEVAPRCHGGTPWDSPWRTTAARLARDARAAMVPAFIAGRNRSRFYVAGRLHPILRTALLAQELLAQRDRTLAVTFGAPISAWQAGGDARTATAQVRAAMEHLALVARDARGGSAEAVLEAQHEQAYDGWFHAGVA